jgi:hypothetical protein
LFCRTGCRLVRLVKSNGNSDGLSTKDRGIIRFLGGPAARTINGQAIHANGGLTPAYDAWAVAVLRTHCRINALGCQGF